LELLLLLLLLLGNLLRERRHRLMISKSTASGGKLSTGKDQRDLRRGKLGSTATEQRRRGAASYLDTSRRGRDETATHTGKVQEEKEERGKRWVSISYFLSSLYM
jgi:hypothetical protein